MSNLLICLTLFVESNLKLPLCWGYKPILHFSEFRKKDLLRARSYPTKIAPGGSNDICQMWIRFSGTHKSPTAKFDSSPSGQNGRHFADDMFKSIFLNENKISLKYVPWGLIDNISALVQVMAWRRWCDMPLAEPMLTQVTDAYMRH